MKSQKYDDLLIPLKEVYGKESWLSIRRMINMPLEFKEEFLKKLIGKELKNTLFYNNEKYMDKFFISILALGCWN